MKLTLYQIIAALFMVLGVFFLAAPSAQAQTLTIPQQFSYAGLTFVEPITYSKQLPIKKETLTFTLPEKIQVTHQDTNQVIGEIILQPTMITPLTLPLLPTQLPPVAYQTKAEAALKIEVSKAPAPTIKASATQAPAPFAAAVSTAPTAVPATSPVSSPVTQTSNVGGLDAEKLFAMSNAFRQARGLPAFQKDERACSLAASRAPEIAGEVAGGVMHSGLRARNLPYWNSENIISMRTEEAAFNWWVNDKIHHDAIVGNYTYSCVACSGNSCAQEFTNFQPK